MSKKKKNQGKHLVYHDLKIIESFYPEKNKMTETNSPLTFYLHSTQSQQPHPAKVSNHSLSARSNNNNNNKCVVFRQNKR